MLETMYKQVRLDSSGDRMIIRLPHRVWNHICCTWSSLTGHWNVIVNGTISNEVYAPYVGAFLAAGNKINLGWCRFLVSKNSKVHFLYDSWLECGKLCRPSFPHFDILAFNISNVWLACARCMNYIRVG